MSKAKSANIKEVAREAGCSVSTVSYALNGGPRRVSAETVERVREAALRVGYEAVRPVTLHRRSVAKTIGVMGGSGTAERFEQAIIRGFLGSLASAAAGEGYHLHLFCPVSYEPSGLASMVLQGGCDGLILMAPYGLDSVIEALAQERFPVVALCGSLSPSCLSVGSDNEGGLRQAMSHLIRLGHRRIAYVEGRKDLFDGVERGLAFQRLAKEFKLEVRPEWVIPGFFTRESGWQASRVVIAMHERPTAIICSNDEEAEGLIRGLIETGFRVPQDFSVTGFDDIEFTRYTQPRITTVRQRTSAMAKAAVDVLCQAVAGGKPPRSTLMSTELIVRDSTAPPHSS